MKTIATFIIAMALAGVVAAEPSTQPTAQITDGIRMRLAAPKVPALETSDPLDTITQQMTGVVDNIAAMKTGHTVQRDQKEIVDNLDAIIQVLEKQKSGSGSGSRHPSKPMTDSRIAGGPGGEGEMQNPNLESRNFGTLPPKDRDAILQSKTEGFPPGYESLLQSYYLRLAEDKTPAHQGGAADPAPPSGNNP